MPQLATFFHLPHLGRVSSDEVCSPGAHAHTGGIRLRESLSEHETFALLICCVCGGGTGKPAVVYEGRAESCPSGFFMEVGARPADWNQQKIVQGRPRLWKADEACDQAAIQSAYH
jgi:hypothetical protein